MYLYYYYWVIHRIVGMCFFGTTLVVRRWSTSPLTPQLPDYVVLENIYFDLRTFCAVIYEQNDA